MQKIADVVYAPEHGIRGLADIYLPENADNAPAALVIHGGGWSSMDKNGLAGVALMLAEWGWGALAINYRLLDQAPWPGCGDDCLRAADYLQKKSHPALAPLDTSKILVIGGSAGGHLAMMTGLRLPRERVRAIVSIAGPSDLRISLDKWKQSLRERIELFYGPNRRPTDEDCLAASPVTYVRADSPPLLCVHSINDKLVIPEQSHRIVDRYKAAGVRAELFEFSGPGDAHGIWINDVQPRRLLAEPTEAIRAFLKTV